MIQGIERLRDLAIAAERRAMRAEIALIDYKAGVQLAAIRRDYDLLRLRRAELRIVQGTAAMWFAASSELEALVKRYRRVKQR